MPDRTVRSMTVATLACVALAALAVAWGSIHKVVRNEPAASIFIVNTLTGTRTFCGPEWCRKLPHG